MRPSRDGNCALQQIKKLMLIWKDSLERIDTGIHVSLRFMYGAIQV